MSAVFGMSPNTSVMLMAFTVWPLDVGFGLASAFFERCALKCSDAFLRWRQSASPWPGMPQKEHDDRAPCCASRGRLTGFWALALDDEARMPLMRILVFRSSQDSFWDMSACARWLGSSNLAMIFSATSSGDSGSPRSVRRACMSSTWTMKVLSFSGVVGWSSRSSRVRCSRTRLRLTSGRPEPYSRSRWANECRHCSVDAVEGVGDSYACA